MPKRKERVAPPPAPGGWDFRFATNDAVKGWEQICSAAAANARTAWERITADPRQRDSRQHPLKGSLGSRAVNGVEMEQWRCEVTAGGRIWYCIDDDRRIVWMIQTHLPTTISVDRIVETTKTNVGPVTLRQLRELIADLLGL